MTPSCQSSVCRILNFYVNIFKIFDSCPRRSPKYRKPKNLTGGNIPVGPRRVNLFFVVVRLRSPSRARSRDSAGSHPEPSRGGLFMFKKNGVVMGFSGVSGGGVRSSVPRIDLGWSREFLKRSPPASLGEAAGLL